MYLFKCKIQFAIMSTCAFLMFLSSSNVFAQQVSVTVDTTKDQEVLAGSHALARKNTFGICITYPFSIRLTQMPQNGTVRLVKTSDVLRRSKIQFDQDKNSAGTHTDNTCLGEVVPMIKEYYKPRAGFVGYDVYRVAQVFDDGQFDSTVIVNVRENTRIDKDLLTRALKCML